MQTTFSIISFTCVFTVVTVCHFITQFTKLPFRHIFQAIDLLSILFLKALPELARVLGLQIPGGAFADLLMVQEFVHNFGEALDLGKNLSRLIDGYFFVSLLERCCQTGDNIIESYEKV